MSDIQMSAVQHTQILNLEPLMSVYTISHIYWINIEFIKIAKMSHAYSI
jgi:hypothetical protein